MPTTFYGCSAEYYSHCLKYIYRNSVKAKIVCAVEAYQWSTISRDKRRLHAEIEPPKTGHDAHMPRGKKQLLTWLNDANTEEEDLQISRALSKTTFKLSANKQTGKQIKPKLK